MSSVISNWTVLDSQTNGDKHMADITFNGMTMEFSVVEFMMDAKTKAEIQSKNPGCSEQKILDDYLVLHKEKFGKDFLQS